MQAAGAIGFALQGFSMIMGARGEAAAAAQEAGRLKNAEIGAKTRAAQIDTAYREDLASTIANIRAISASANVGAGSPTQLALQDEEARISNRSRRIETGNELMAARQFSADRKQTLAAGKAALRGGMLGSIPWFIKAGASLY